MKTDNGNRYRFCLQFPASSDDYCRVGDCLEKLGRKKSDFVVAAILEYLERHPEVMPGSVQIQIHKARIDRAELEQMVRRILSEQMQQPTQEMTATETGDSQAQNLQSIAPAIADAQVAEALDSMLDHLADFM